MFDITFSRHSKMSLTLWERYGKMSPRQDKTVFKVTQKYRSIYPTLDRDLLRKLIRLENPSLFSNSTANLKQLDRCLKKIFENFHPCVTINGKEPEWIERGFLEYPSKEAQFEGAIQFMRQKGFKLSKDGKTWIRWKNE